MAGESTGVSDLQGLAGLGTQLFGSGSSVSGTSLTKGTTSETGFERLKVDQAAIDQIIQDVLGGADGLAAIFQGEQTAGIFNSSVAAQASGDLAAKLVGEIAKLTAEKQTGTTSSLDSSTSSDSEEDVAGLLDPVLGGIGDMFSSVDKTNRPPTLGGSGGGSGATLLDFFKSTNPGSPGRI